MPFARGHHTKPEVPAEIGRVESELVLALLPGPRVDGRDHHVQAARDLAVEAAHDAAGRLEAQLLANGRVLLLGELPQREALGELQTRGALLSRLEQE